MDYNSVLLKSVCEMVLEQIAFLFSESAEERVDISGDDWYYGTMEFCGPLLGTMQIATRYQLSRLLAANMLGVEPEEEQSVRCAGDAVKELLNIVCGRFLTEAFGEDTVFTLSAPDVFTKSSTFITETMYENAVCIKVEQEILLIMVRLTG